MSLRSLYVEFPIASCRATEKKFNSFAVSVDQLVRAVGVGRVDTRIARGRDLAVPKTFIDINLPITN